MALEEYPAASQETHAVAEEPMSSRCASIVHLQTAQKLGSKPNWKKAAQRKQAKFDRHALASSKHVFCSCHPARSTTLCGSSYSSYAGHRAFQVPSRLRQYLFTAAWARTSSFFFCKWTAGIFATAFATQSRAIFSKALSLNNTSTSQLTSTYPISFPEMAPMSCSRGILGSIFHLSALTSFACVHRLMWEQTSPWTIRRRDIHQAAASGCIDLWMALLTVTRASGTSSNTGTLM